MNIFDLRHGIDQDESELGLRVACALFVENVTDKENFLRILKFQYSLRVKDKKNGSFMEF